MEGYLLLEDGTTFKGKLFGWSADISCEIVFNTSMTGYLETITDSACSGQGLVMTYPIIGSYGVNLKDSESDKPHAECLIVREISERASNYRSEYTLKQYLQHCNIPCLYEIDTRFLARILRDKGTMKGVISNSPNALKDTKAFEDNDGTKTVYCGEKRTYEAKDGGTHNIALLDTGVKRSILKALTDRGCNITVYPHNTSAQEILESNPKGIVIANGAGDPKSMSDIIKQIKILIKSQTPMLGIALGHQLIALAKGADTFKLKLGHRGSNYPVKDIQTGLVYISTENCGYAVSKESISSDGKISFINVNDQTVEGLTYPKILTTQFYPETAIGKNNTSFVFDTFIQIMEGCVQ